MKKKLTTCFSVLLFASNCCFSQNKVTRYCELAARPYNKISINFGSSDLYIMDSTMAKCIIDVPRFNNIIDALNYMSERGWKLITTSVLVPSFRVFYLEKEFDKPVIVNLKSTE